ncbi:PREDICTED: cell wall protein RBR3-like [Wasmannia auropunctata]|uniref:cell wall protein RBR3-like n=1 Tax=Wasmannia auropunctata TaxID=64793 RepID=UPI0005ED858F|nr:PREDICTED: cell wall protein RBR3-like [Wasmannia auropunctata]
MSLQINNKNSFLFFFLRNFGLNCEGEISSSATSIEQSSTNKNVESEQYIFKGLRSELEKSVTSQTSSQSSALNSVAPQTSSQSSVFRPLSPSIGHIEEHSNSPVLNSVAPQTSSQSSVRRLSSSPSSIKHSEEHSGHSLTSGHYTSTSDACSTLSVSDTRKKNLSGLQRTKSRGKSQPDLLQNAVHRVTSLLENRCSPTSSTLDPEIQEDVALCQLILSLLKNMPQPKRTEKRKEILRIIYELRIVINKLLIFSVK